MFTKCHLTWINIFTFYLSQCLKTDFPFTQGGSANGEALTAYVLIALAEANDNFLGLNVSTVRRNGPQIVLSSRQETDSSAHDDTQSKQHHVYSNVFDLHSTNAHHRCFRIQHGHVLCLHYNSDFENPLACPRRHVCTRALTGWAHLSIRGWREVNWLNQSCIILCATFCEDVLVQNARRWARGKRC